MAEKTRRAVDPNPWANHPRWKAVRERYNGHTSRSEEITAVVDMVKWAAGRPGDVEPLRAELGNLALLLRVARYCNWGVDDATRRDIATNAARDVRVWWAVTRTMLADTREFGPVTEKMEALIAQNP
jgi:hypothetical protein